MLDSCGDVFMNLFVAIQVWSSGCECDNKQWVVNMITSNELWVWSQTEEGHDVHKKDVCKGNMFYNIKCINET